MNNQRPINGTVRIDDYMRLMGTLTPCVAVNTAEIAIRSRLQETTEHGSNRACQPENHRALTDLARRVPRSQHVVNTRIEARSEIRHQHSTALLRSSIPDVLKKSNEESQCVEGLVRLY